MKKSATGEWVRERRRFFTLMAFLARDRENERGFEEGVNIVSGQSADLTLQEVEDRSLADTFNFTPGKAAAFRNVDRLREANLDEGSE